MAQIVQSKPQVINTMKRVKEEIVRFDMYDNSGTITLSPGDDTELQLYEGSGADYYTVRIGECIELLALGTESASDATTPANAYLDLMTVKDFNGSQWNQFGIVPEEVSLSNTNELPFNRQVNFERLMMSWGYKSFLSSSDDIAPTLKLPEGDRLRIFQRAKAGTGNDLTLSTAPYCPTYAIIRRYLPGSDVDYKHFDQYDGGLKSTKRYWNDVQFLSTTTAGQYTSAWELEIIRNEAYKFFQAGIGGEVASTFSNLVDAKIMIDDPLTEYNKYFVNPSYNILPFTPTYTTYQVNDGTGATFTDIETTHRFAPTIDVVKNRNKDLKMYVKDNGTASTKLMTRFYGVRYVL